MEIGAEVWPVTGSVTVIAPGCVCWKKLAGIVAVSWSELVYEVERVVGPEAHASLTIELGLNPVPASVTVTGVPSVLGL
jgi:hypothetical protein